MDDICKVISVIIPVFNGEAYIERCLKSVETALTNMGTEHGILDGEIIVIDDGSTDGTGKILSELKKTYENLTVIEGKDEGVSISRNRGIDAAKGKYISFVDADDMVQPLMFKVLLSKALKENADIVGCDFIRFSDEMPEEKVVVDEISFFRYSSKDYPEKQILNGNSRCWSKLYLRDTIGNIRFKEGLTIGEDMLFLTDVSLKSENILECDYKGYGYYQNIKGVMLRPFRASQMDQITCWEMLLSRLKDINSEQRVCELAASRVIINILLVASKLALLDKKDRDNFKDCIKVCREKFMGMQSAYPGAKAFLDRGYRIKSMIFNLSPKVYMGLYNNWKR